MPKSDLLRSHEQLSAAVRVAGKEIRKLNFGRSDMPVLTLLQPRAVGSAGGPRRRIYQKARSLELQLRADRRA
jgi:hypothetical protein